MRSGQCFLDMLHIGIACGIMKMTDVPGLPQVETGANWPAGVAQAPGCSSCLGGSGGNQLRA